MITRHKSIILWISNIFVLTFLYVKHDFVALSHKMEGINFYRLGEYFSQVGNNNFGGKFSNYF